MTSPFEGYEVDARLRPSQGDAEFDLNKALSAVVALEAKVPDDAFTAGALGTERLGNGVVIGAGGLVLTIGYLITEAEEVRLTLNDGRRVYAHVLGVDPVSGFGLVQAMEPLGLPPLELGDSRTLGSGEAVILAGGGGLAHASAGRVLSRQPFAGYWEYLLDQAIFTAPAHPHWSGAALIDEAGRLVGIGSLNMLGEVEGGAMPINMFVPSELLPPILEDLKQGRPPHAPRPWLGVLAQELGARVVVVGVNPGGPAARAELREGDLILAVGDHPVSELADFYKRMWAQGRPGATIPLKIQRDDDVFDVEIRSADRTALLRKPKFN